MYGDNTAALRGELATLLQVTRNQQGLDTLTPEKRTVFILYELEGESCDAIAAGLGIPVGTVYSRLHSARRDFARAHDRLVEDTPSASGLPPGAVAGARA